MKIIYLHHAERDRINKGELRQLDDITLNGVKDAELVSEMFKKVNVSAIYTSPYLRCVHTAQIINQHINVPIYNDERFIEKEYNETWIEFLNRNMNAIDDIVKKYNEDDTIICVTSGVNLSAFICYFYNITPSSDAILAQGVNCSPINFYINSKHID